MSLNKSRKRLIKKYHRMFNSHPIDIKISTDGGKTFKDMGNIPCASATVIPALWEAKAGGSPEARSLRPT